MNKISIILPVYNGEKYLRHLIPKIRSQKIDAEVEVIAAVSKSKDNSLQVAQELCDIAYLVDFFNHAKTRHEAALKGSGNVFVFITQDITPYDDYWLRNLVTPLLEDQEIAATYSRQIAYPDASETERLIREFNYPDYDRLCNNSTKEKWGRKNIFYSDSASATRRDVYLELGGYNFEVGTNEDVIYAINVINNGYSILYNSKSKVYHSHDFEVKAAFSRYKLIGAFERQFEEELKEYSSMGEGKKLLLYLLPRLVKKLKVKDLGLLPVDLATRYFGYKKGFTNS